VAAERIAGAESWKAPQFVQADAAGHVFLLRSDTLEVYPVTRKGTLGAPSKLEGLASGEEHPFIRDAALAPGGGDWLLLDAREGPRLFRGGKEQTFPELGWLPTAVALPAGQPLVAVLPAPLREISLRKEASGKVVFDSPELPPMLMTLSGSEWKAVAREDYDFGSATWAVARGRMHLMRDVRLAADAKGAVWTAEEYGYRLRKFSPAGKLQSELTVGRGKPVLRERSPEELDKQQAEFRKATGQSVNPASIRFTASRGVDGLVAARDGRIYIVAEVGGEGANGHLALDRFDPTGPTLERLFVERIPGGRLSVAAGQDGLYVAAFSGEGGLWKLPWEMLDGAKWERVTDAKWNGEELAAPQP
jgi:hypothetical protein